MRAEEPGWVKIGITCSAGRRSLWWRVNLRAGLLEEEINVVEIKDIASIELCAGREGDDAYVRIENDGGKQFYDLWDVLSCAQFASET